MSAVTENQNRPAQTGNRQAPAAPQNGRGRGYVMPPANISATENEYVVEVEMPGVNKEGLEVTVEGNELTIIGRRAAEVPEGDVVYRESPEANYRRVFELGPDVDTSKITAEMRQGVLFLRLPKSEKAKPKQIEVKVA